MPNRRVTLKWASTLVCLVLGVVLWPTPSRAGNLEPAGINLGFTSFFDGFGRTEEGFTYLNYAQFATASSIKNNQGKSLPYFNNPRIDAFVLVNQLVYTLPEKLFNDSAKVGIDFLVPLVAFDTSFDPPPPAPGATLLDNGVGLGDLTFGPILQFRPVFAGGRPVFSQRFEFDVIAPTGKYDPYKDINQGSNFTSLNPSWAMTVLPLPHFEISARFNYLYNFTNDKPAIGSQLYHLMFQPPVKDAQAGQAGWVNFAISYEPIQTLHVGANGYYFMQFNLDRWVMLNGAVQSGGARENEYNLNDTGRASFLGIGPGLLWEAGGRDKLFANVYFQTLVRNRPQYTVFNLHWIHGF
jgi:hypothetical protein